MGRPRGEDCCDSVVMRLRASGTARLHAAHAQSPLDDCANEGDPADWLSYAR